MLGDEQDDDKEVTILNRTLRWTAGGLEYEADGRHAQEIVGYFGLEEDSKGLTTAMAKEPMGGDAHHVECLDAVRAREYRALAARANYLSLDRPDIQCATKEACREMSAPTTRSMARMKRLARYLLEFPRAVIHYSAENGAQGDGMIDAYADSDWAGCPTTRRSTTGGGPGGGRPDGQVVEQYANHRRAVQWRGRILRYGSGRG